jgi:HK97 family phage portal protein
MKTAADLLAADEARTTRALGGAVRDALAGRERRTSSTFSEPAEWLLQVFGTQSKSGAIVNENSALTVATFGACVNILCSALATPPLRLMKRTAVGAVPCDGQSGRPYHPLYFLVNHEPNAHQSSYNWRSFRTACLCLGGNAYTRIVRDAFFEVSALQPMLPFKTQPRALAGTDYEGAIVYRYMGAELAPWEVLHNRGLSTDGFFGISPIRALRESLGLSLTMQEFTARTFNNGARMPGIFQGPATMTKEKAQEFLQFWTQNYAGASNAGKNPMVFGGMTWAQAGFSNDDAQLLLNKNFEKSEIAGWFRIPEVLLGNTEKTSSWGTGIQQLMLGFVEWTLKPYARSDEQELDRSLLTKEEKLAGYFFAYDFTDLLAGTPNDQAAFFKTLFECGAKTSNEIRHAFGDTELPDGPANQRYVPANLIPDNRPAAAAAAPTPGAPQPAGAAAKP